MNWQCGFCDTVNSADDVSCIVCDRPRGKAEEVADLWVAPPSKVRKPVEPPTSSARRPADSRPSTSPLRRESFAARPDEDRRDGLFTSMHTTGEIPIGHAADEQGASTPAPGLPTRAGVRPRGRSRRPVRTAVGAFASLACFAGAIFLIVFTANDRQKPNSIPGSTAIAQAGPVSVVEHQLEPEPLSTFTSPNGDFTVRVPGTRTQGVDVALEPYVFSYPNGSATVGALRNRGLDLNAEADDLARAMGSQVTSRNPGLVGPGEPALDVEIPLSFGHMNRLRLMAHNGVLYMVGIDGPAEDASTFDLVASSFRFVDDPSTSTPPPVGTPLPG